jgi:5-methylcytosine-specific restriction enzyme A
MGDHRVYFLNVGWMGRYRGLEGDKIIGGGKYVEEHRFGHEVFNFLPYRGQCYGIGHVGGDSIALERLGAPRSSPYLDDVLVVWVARSLVVGWYNHARLYRKAQNPPTGSNRVIHGDVCRYHAVAKESDCKLLAPDARSLAVPRAIGRVPVKGGMGRYVWYAEGHEEYLERLFKFIASEVNGEKKSSGGSRHAQQMDPLKRTQVEEAAETKAKQYYRE